MPNSQVPALGGDVNAEERLRRRVDDGFSKVEREGGREKERDGVRERKIV